MSTWLNTHCLKANDAKTSDHRFSYSLCSLTTWCMVSPTQNVHNTHTHTHSSPMSSCLYAPAYISSSLLFLLLIFKELSTGGNFTTHITPWWSHSFRYRFKASQVPLKIKPQISGSTNQLGEEKKNTFNRQVMTCGRVRIQSKGIFDIWIMFG